MTDAHTKKVELWSQNLTPTSCRYWSHHTTHRCTWQVILFPFHLNEAKGIFAIPRQATAQRTKSWLDAWRTSFAFFLRVNWSERGQALIDSWHSVFWSWQRWECLQVFKSLVKDCGGRTTGSVAAHNWVLCITQYNALLIQILREFPRWLSLIGYILKGLFHLTWACKLGFLIWINNMGEKKVDG